MIFCDSTAGIVSVDRISWNGWIEFVRNGRCEGWNNYEDKTDQNIFPKPIILNTILPIKVVTYVSEWNKYIGRDNFFCWLKP